MAVTVRCDNPSAALALTSCAGSFSETTDLDRNSKLAGALKLGVPRATMKVRLAKRVIWKHGCEASSVAFRPLPELVPH